MRILVDRLPAKPSRCLFSVTMPGGKYGCALRSGQTPCEDTQKCRCLRVPAGLLFMKSEIERSADAEDSDD